MSQFDSTKQNFTEILGPRDFEGSYEHTEHRTNRLFYGTTISRSPVAVLMCYDDCVLKRSLGSPHKRMFSLCYLMLTVFESVVSEDDENDLSSLAKVCVARVSSSTC